MKNLIPETPLWNSKNLRKSVGKQLQIFPQSQELGFRKRIDDPLVNYSPTPLPRLSSQPWTFLLSDSFRSVSFFMAANVRKPVAEGRSDCIPIFLSEIPKLFHRGIYKPDISLIQVCLLSL